MDPPRGVSQGQLDPAGGGVAGDVGQALLHDAVDREFDLTVQSRRVRVDLAVDGDAGAVAEPTGQFGQCADQPEVIQQAWAQFLGDPGDLGDGGADGFLGVAQLAAAAVGDAVVEAFQLHEHAGHGLADLVVQLGGNPTTFGLLGRDRPAGAVAAFGLEPGEHVVERGDQSSDLTAPTGGQWVRRVEQVHLRHPARPGGERGERQPQQHRVDGEHAARPPQHHRLSHRDRPADRDRGDAQHHRGGDKQGRVGGEHPPEQRHPHAACRAGAVFRRRRSKRSHRYARTSATVTTVTIRPYLVNSQN